VLGQLKAAGALAAEKKRTAAESSRGREVESRRAGEQERQHESRRGEGVTRGEERRGEDIMHILYRERERERGSAHY